MELKELESYLEEDTEEYVFLKEESQKSILWVSSRSIHIPKSNIKIKKGFCEEWSQDDEEYDTDHDFYMIFDLLTDKDIYKEVGSGMYNSLGNFLLLNKQQRLTMDELLELQCEAHLI